MLKDLKTKHSKELGEESEKEKKDYEKKRLLSASTSSSLKKAKIGFESSRQTTLHETLSKTKI